MKTQIFKGIAIVDDEKSYADLLAVTLGECFLNPVHAFTRPQAFLETLPSLELGVLVTDYQMPQLSGLELIGEVRKQRPGLPCLLITGQAAQLNGLNLSHLPELRGILHKPFSWKKLAAEILKVAPVSPRL